MCSWRGINMASMFLRKSFFIIHFHHIGGSYPDPSYIDSMHYLRPLGILITCFAVIYTLSIKIMATARFSNLPAEIHFNIAEHCANNEIINLCLTSKLMYERCSWVLFRHVDLQLDQYGWGALRNLSYIQKLSAIIDRQKQFVRLLLSHPEYGKHIRFFKTELWIPSFDNCHGLGENPISDDELWRAMRLLTNVRGVDIGSKNTFTQIKSSRLYQKSMIFQRICFSLQYR